jgi:L-histidine Nalpha-methyltransferase
VSEHRSQHQRASSAANTTKSLRADSDVFSEIYLDPGALAELMADDVRAGLTAMPKTLPPKYFYDARGSELFDEITRLPEYYPTRTERAILLERAADVAATSRAETLVELGSGTSEKTRLLLHALREAGTLRRFIPFDVDPAVLKDASAAVSAEFPGLAVEPVVGDFERHLAELPRHRRRLLAFLGSTIGNLDPHQRAVFLRDVRGALGPGDAFLLGTDLVKSPERLVAAYDDAAGVTAAFNKNLLAVLNRDLGADFDPDEFDHVAIWDAEHEWIEMRLRSRRDQAVRIAALELDVHFARGEELRTEISAKFRRAGVEAELAAAGLRVTQWWTDPAGDFALSLSVPA